MKRAGLSPFTLQAIAITGGRAEYERRNAPTWDGTCWHFARLESEAHVLHEIAHWIAATPSERGCPNYALGSDPDGGPRTEIGLPIVEAILDVMRRASPLAFNRLPTDWSKDGVVLVGMLRDQREEESSLLTLMMMNAAGLEPAAERAFDGFVRDPACAWSAAERLVERGIDPQDPLGPFEMAAMAARSA
jgi:hypothetical protein